MWVAGDADLPVALMMNYAYQRAANVVWDMVSVQGLGIRPTSFWTCYHLLSSYIACMQFVHKISAVTQRVHTYDTCIQSCLFTHE